MKAKSGFTSKKMDDFLGKLSDLVGSLPSPDEKSRIDNDLRMLISYLEGIRKQLELVPTSSQVDPRSSIERLRELLKVADVDPLLSRVLGFPTNGRRTRRRVGALTDDARIRAGKVAQELETLTDDAVRAKLLDKTYSVALLRQIGSELRIRIPSRSSRSSIIETIAGKLANRRGYNILRHGGTVR